MNIADHLRPLLRDHDCVIIPDFGGLVAEYTPARVQPGGRHLLSPPTRQVAFNQALTRNDGLLVDALRQHLGLPATEAREAVRLAVAALHHELQSQQRTELPGIGVFRHVAGRGLQFEYTGTDNLLAAAFGLPELVAHPVRVTDVRLAREQQAQLVPRLRSASRGFNWRRAVPGATIGLLAGLAVASLYLFNLHPAALPVAWRGYLPRWEQVARPAPPQQATLAQPSLAPEPVAAEVPATQPEAVSAEEAHAELASARVAPSVALAPSAAAPAPVATPAAKEAVDNEVLSARMPSLEVASAAPSLPQQVAHQTPDPVEAMLTQPAPTRKKKNKVPPAALPAVADESNIARPVPLALRPPSGANVLRVPPTAPKAAAASAPVAPPKAVAPVAHAPGRAATAPAHAPAARPVLSVRSSKALTVVPPKKTLAPVPAKPAAPKPVAKAPALAFVPPVAAPAAPAAAGATTIKSRTGRYYVVVAAYGSLARAEQGRRNLAHAGRPAKIIMPPAGSRLYRLSAADFADRPTALLTAAHLRQNPHFDKGLTIYPY